LTSAIALTLFSTSFFFWINIRSVRHRPMPCAPRSRARCVSRVASALALAPSVATSSARDSSVAMSRENSTSTVGTSPKQTAPLAPPLVITCPSLCTAGPTWAVLLCTSTTMLSAPETQGLPMPRATTAACEILPPRKVRMPCAAKKP